MLFKMLGIERTYDSMRETMLETFHKPRQIFVTQSRVLAEKVEEYFAKLSESHAAAQRTAEQSVQMAQTKLTSQDQGLVDRDEEQYHRGDLPKSYGDLRDEHFPLFLTFDHVGMIQFSLRGSPMTLIVPQCRSLLGYWKPSSLLGNMDPFNSFLPALAMNSHPITCQTTTCNSSELRLSRMGPSSTRTGLIFRRTLPRTLV